MNMFYIFNSARWLLTLVVHTVAMCLDMPLEMLRSWVSRLRSVPLNTEYYITGYSLSVTRSECQFDTECPSYLRVCISSHHHSCMKQQSWHTNQRTNKVSALDTALHSYTLSLTHRLPNSARGCGYTIGRCTSESLRALKPCACQSIMHEMIALSR